MKRFLLLGIVLVLTLIILAACDQQSDEPILDTPPTATLQPISTRTPRATSTQVPTRTPFPTFTFTPTETSVPPTPTLSLTPTLTPTVQGIVQSAAQRVNIREAPDVNSSAITSLPPGTGVLVIGQNADGTWVNIRLEDGREGWISERLLFVPATPTPFPSATPSPDLTALFLGTPLPTAILGGGTVTPTPPAQVRTGTPESNDTAETSDITAEPTDALIGGVPVIDNDSIYQTATALAGGIFTPEPRATDDSSDDDADSEPDDRSVTLAPDATAPAPDEPVATVDIATVDGRDVFAYCDDPSYGYNPPLTLNEGDFIDIWWAWIASTEEQIQEHIDTVSYDLRVNGDPIDNVNDYVGEILPAQGGGRIVYWYVPYGPLESGDVEITYVTTWERAIFDGFENFGPGTENPFQQETCTFTVR